MLRLTVCAASFLAASLSMLCSVGADPGEFPNFEAAARQAGKREPSATTNVLRENPENRATTSTGSAAKRQPAALQEETSSPAFRSPQRDPARVDNAARKASSSQPLPSADPSEGEAEILAAYKLTRSAKNEEDYTEVIERLQHGLEMGVSRKMAAYARQLNAWAHNKRNEARSAAELPEEALSDFEAAVSLDNTNWRAVNNRGVSRAVLGDPVGAIADFSRVLELNPRFAGAYFNRAEMRYERRDFAGAIEDYSRALKSTPRDVAALNSRGHAYYRLAKYSQAMADYDQALQIDPGNAAALVNRGDLHADLGDFNSAAEDYRSAISTKPNFGRAYQSAAWLMSTCPDERFRETELAIEIAQKAIELDGTGDYRYLETLSAAQANAGEFELAAETLAEAMRHAPAAVAKVYRGRIAKFQAGEPHREPAKKMAAAAPSRR